MKSDDLHPTGTQRQLPDHNDRTATPLCLDSRSAASHWHGLVPPGRSAAARATLPRHAFAVAQRLWAHLGMRRPDGHHPAPQVPAWSAAANEPHWPGATSNPIVLDEPTATGLPTLPALAKATRPTVLRSIRWIDHDATHSAMRLRLSGRMADVCAELDRLAALEARHVAP